MVASMKSNPFQGRYLFHFHTNLTDGNLTVRDYFAWAQAQGVQNLLFLEHIRRQASYNAQAFIEEVKALERSTGIRACVGFETKLLPDGTLDISHEDLASASIIGIAEHGFTNDPVVLHAAFKKVVSVLPGQYPDCSFVWVHPGLWFKKRAIELSTNSIFKAMLEQANESHVLVERNLRYGLLEGALLYKVPKEKLVIGADAHNASDLETWRRRIVGSQLA
jgi:histidinol phosphatase-like PHP family hydrolase